MSNTKISRRELMQTAGSVVVGFQLMSSPLGMAQVPDGAASSPYANPDYLDPRALDSWLAVLPDGKITIFTGKVDLGTGVETALAQIAAEELDVPFDRVRMAMGDTAKTVDQGRTAGSQTLMRAGPQLRQAAAAARLEILKLASNHLLVPVDRLSIHDGVISVSGQPEDKVSYAELIGGKPFNKQISATGLQWTMVIAPEVKPKNYADYKIVGTSIPRVELPAKLTGEFTFTPDIRVPGMLHGRAVRPATVIPKAVSVDESSVAHIPGIVKVVHEGSFVGVVAQTEWAAVQAAKALKVTWSGATSKMPSGPEKIAEYLGSTPSARDLTSVNKGNVDEAFAGAHKTFEATYHWPFQVHGMMGPSCAVADVQQDKVTVWTGAQGPFTTRDRVASMLGVPKRTVSVIFAESSGCYGRLTADDAAEDAVLLSRAVGKPVRVQWMRDDEQIWSPKGPQQLLTARAGVDKDGNLVAWDYLDRGLPWTEAQGTPQLAERQIGIQTSLLGNPNGVNGGGEYYAIPNQRVRGAVIPWPQDEPNPLRTCALRSPGEPARNFGSECFMDEIAAALGVDAIQYRLRHLKTQRIKDALVAAAKSSGWKERPSPAPATGGPIAVGRGTAVSVRFDTVIAAIADVEVEKATGNVTVKRITLAHDCGLIVNPDGLKFQLEGNVMQGVSRALLEEFKFDESGAKSKDWSTYPVIRFKNVPDVELVLINHPEIPPSGGAEPAIIVIASAIGNAIFDAIGARVRQVPFTPGRVRVAMQNKSQGPSKA